MITGKKAGRQPLCRLKAVRPPYFRNQNRTGVIFMTLDQLAIGREAEIIAVGGQGGLRRRLLDMGLTPRTKVKIRKVAPMGDPIELTLRGYELTLRLEDAKKIEIEEL